MTDEEWTARMVRLEQGRARSDAEALEVVSSLERAQVSLEETRQALRELSSPDGRIARAQRRFVGTVVIGTIAILLTLFASHAFLVIHFSNLLSRQIGSF